MTPHIKEKRVRWTEDEKTELINRSVNILHKNVGMSILEALRRAQESFMPPDRRRIVTSLTTIPWYKPAIDKRMHEHVQQKIEQMADEKVDSKIIEQVVVVPINLTEISSDELISELLRRILVAGGSGIMTQLTNTLAATLRAELPAAISRLNEKPQEVKERRRKILIVGLMPDQANEIKNDFGSAFDLSFWKDENIHMLKSKAVNQDKIYVMKKFISHTYQDALKSAKSQYTIVPGAISELKAVLEKYFFETN